MILRLVREQLRSQWRYTAWSAGLLAFALGLATYAMVTGATAIALRDANDEFTPREHAAFFHSAIGTAAEDPALAGLENLLPFDQVTALIAQASDEVPVTAVVQTHASLSTPGDILIAAVATPFRWDRYLAEGAAPQHGQVVVNYALAHDDAIAVGDRVAFTQHPSVGRDRGMTFTVSGILKDFSVAPYWTYPGADAYVAWSDAEAVVAGLPSVTVHAGGTEATALETFVAWDGYSAVLAPFSTIDYWAPQGTGFSFTEASLFTDTTGRWLLVAAALAVLGTIVAAFGMGRAQAEARTRWAATARVLGATRRTVALSSVVETAIVSLAGIAVGLAAGVAAVAATLGVLHARHPDALLPATPSVPRALLVTGVGVGLLIAGAVAAVPAFWSARVAPVAALKPVTPVSEARVSRDVSPWWPVGILGGSIVVASGLQWFVERLDGSGMSLLPVALGVAVIVMVVAGAAVAVEGARRIVAWLGRRLSLSRRPWLIAAGDGLTAHRRLFTFASLASGGTAGAFAWVVTANAASPYYRSSATFGWGDAPIPSFAEWWHNDLPGSLLVGAALLFAGVVTFVAVIVTLSSRASFATDAATRAALGLTPNGERVAAATRQFAVMATAATGGAVLGWAARLIVRLVGASLSPFERVSSVHWNLTVAGYALAATGVALAVILAVALAGSLVVGLLGRSRTPVEALRRAAG